MLRSLLSFMSMHHHDKAVGLPPNSWTKAFLIMKCFTQSREFGKLLMNFEHNVNELCSQLDSLVLSLMKLKQVRKNLSFLKSLKNCPSRALNSGILFHFLSTKHKLPPGTHSGDISKLATLWQIVLLVSLASHHKSFPFFLGAQSNYKAWDHLATSPVAFRRQFL